jgi:hypothetical protein
MKLVTMDINRRNRLLELIKAKGTPVGQAPGPTVSLEDFFEGNDDQGSIGCNLFLHPGISKFYQTLAEIKSRSDVQDVLVEIRDLVDEHSWPFSDSVFVLTSMSVENLRKLMSKLKADEVGQFPAGSTPKDLPLLETGMQILGAWWD